MAEVPRREPYAAQTLADQEQAMKAFAAMARRRLTYATTQEQADDYAFTVGKILQPATEGFARCYPRAARLTINRTEIIEGDEGYGRWMRGEYPSGRGVLGVYPLTETVIQSGITLVREGLGSDDYPDFGDYGYLASIDRLVFGTPDSSGKATHELIVATEVLSMYGYDGAPPTDLIRSYFYEFAGRETADDVHTTTYENSPLLHDNDNNINRLKPELARQVLDEEAAAVFARYGAFGLAQLHIHSGMNNICAGLLG